MDWDYTNLSNEEQQQLHQQLIQFGEMLQKSPNFRSKILEFVKTLGPMAFSILPKRTLESYAQALEKSLPDTSTENQLRQQVRSLEERLQWAVILGDTISYPPDTEELEWLDFPCFDDNSAN